jgi:hypothetical protein
MVVGSAHRCMTCIDFVALKIISADLCALDLSGIRCSEEEASQVFRYIFKDRGGLTPQEQMENFSLWRSEVKDEVELAIIDALVKEEAEFLEVMQYIWRRRGGEYGRLC